MLSDPLSVWLLWIQPDLPRFAQKNYHVSTKLAITDYLEFATSGAKRRNGSMPTHGGSFLEKERQNLAASIGDE